MFGDETPKLGDELLHSASVLSKLALPLLEGCDCVDSPFNLTVLCGPGYNLIIKGDYEKMTTLERQMAAALVW